MTTTTKASTPIDLGISYARTDLSTPVAMLNPESTLRDRIFYCASMADSLRGLSDVLQETDDEDVCKIAELFGALIDPLASVLNELRGDVYSQDKTHCKVQP